MYVNGNISYPQVHFSLLIIISDNGFVRNVSMVEKRLLIVSKATELLGVNLITIE